MRDLILTGFMGVGKTTTARLLADTYGLRFVDTDSEIERRTGRSIPEIFDQDGEAAFRRLEGEVFADIIRNGEGRVVSTGGGTLLAAENRALVGPDQTVIALTCSLEESFQRAMRGAQRPLLSPSGRTEAARLLEARAPLYHLYPQVDSSTGADVLGAVAEIAGPARVGRLEFGDIRSSEIVFGRGMARRLGGVLAGHGLVGTILVLTDSTIVATPWMHKLVDSLGTRGDKGDGGTHVCVISAGEQHKTLQTVERIYREAMSHRLDRSSIVVGVGGGVVCDLAGMVASTYLRGLRLVLAPSTLLAQVDASIGGKTGVDLDGVKNIVGSFYPADLVVIDPDLLATLPPLALSDGLAEIVKIAAVRSRELLEWTETLPQAGAIRDHIAIVRRAAAEKIRIVAQDPYERDLRALLNFGHTVGHALEAESAYTVSHGQAVSAGMLAEAVITERTGRCAVGVTDRLAAVLGRLGLPLDISCGNTQRAWEIMQQDKKRRNGKIRFAVPVEIGNGQVIEMTEVDARTAIDHAVGVKP